MRKSPIDHIEQAIKELEKAKRAIYVNFSSREQSRVNRIEQACEELKGIKNTLENDAKSF